MSNRKNYTYKVCLCDGCWCDGHISVQADTEEDSYEMAMDYVLTKLADALPELGIDVFVELDEEEEITEDKEIEALWDELENVPLVRVDYLGTDWGSFPKGTPLKEIWDWFNRKHSKGLPYLLSKYE